MQALKYAKLKAAITTVRAFMFPLYRNVKWLEQDPPSKVIVIDAPRTPKAKLTLNIYWPNDQPPPAGTPIHLNFHGNAWVFQFYWGSSASFCRKLADDLNIIVIDASYPIAPENSHPHALHAAADIFNHILTDDAFGHPTHVTVGGFSNGGALALNLASTQLSQLIGVDPEHQKKIKACIASGPPVAYHVETKSKNCNDDGLPKDVPGLPMSYAVMEHFADCILWPDVSRQDPTISPALADPTSFKDVNSFTFVTASHDPYRFEGVALHESLKAAGIDSTHYRAEGVGHGFEADGTDDKVSWTKLGEDSPVGKARKDSYDLFRRRIAEALGKPVPAATATA